MNTQRLLAVLRGWSRKISPPLPVAGLFITDSAVRYAYIKGGGDAVRASLRLTPGVVQEGRVKSKEALVAVLRELYERVSPSSGSSLSVVLSLPVRDVYIQSFSVPRVAEGNFEEAAELNARMTSPIKADTSYYGWQRLALTDRLKSEIDLLGAFVPRAVADPFIEALELAGFGVAAVEFASMSLVRDIESRKVVKAGEPYTVIEVTAEGLTFVAVRKDIPHFHYLHSWSEVQGSDKAISFESLKQTLREELARLLNFYATHWKDESMHTIVLITPAFAEEMNVSINEAFSELTVHALPPSEASVAHGAALRGSVPRSEDTGISLASLSALDVFEQNQTVNFVRIWRNVFLAGLGFILATFVVVNVTVRRELARVVLEREVVTQDPNAREFVKLQERARRFNDLVASVTEVRSQGSAPSGLLAKIDELSGNDIALTRVNFESLAVPVRVNGIAPNQRAAVDFKNRIEAQEQFTNVGLPLSDVTDDGNTVSFTLTFEVTSLDFGE